MSETTTQSPAPEATAPATTQEAPKPQAPAANPPTERRKDEPEGDWRDRFEAQQKVNRDLEAKLNGLRDGLRSALGVEDKKDGGDLIATLQEQVAAMQRDGLVDRVARRHGITEDADVELLRTASDEATMQRLAERLKVSNSTPNTPAPDPSQASAPLSEEAAADAAYKAFFPDTSK